MSQFIPCGYEFIPILLPMPHTQVAHYRPVQQHCFKLQVKMRGFYFLSFHFCHVGGPAIIQKGEWAKFGYRPDRKVEKFRNLALLWRPPQTWYLNMVASDFYFFTPQNMAIFSHFYIKKLHFVQFSWEYFYGWPQCKILHQKKALVKIVKCCSMNFPT